MKPLLTTFLILLFIGCGSRKAEVEKLNIEIKKKNEVISNLKNDIQSNTRIHKVAKKTIAEPIDESKPSTFNGTSFQNARITIEETESDSTATLNAQSETNISAKEESEVDSRQVQRDVESKKGNPWLWLTIFGVSVFLIWMVFKYKPWK